MDEPLIFRTGSCVVKVLSRLIQVQAPSDPAGVVVVLHGGGSRAPGARVSPTQPSVLRMVATARRVARENRDLAVYRLLNSTRGWDTRHSPVDDVGWAIRDIATATGRALPVCLVGHSLGGRAALLGAAANASVVAAVALNPYLYAEDGHTDLSGRRVLIVHGTEDRVASLDVAEAVAGQLARRTSVDLVRVRGGEHAMLRRHKVFDGLAAQFVASMVARDEPRELLEGLARHGRWREV